MLGAMGWVGWVGDGELYYKQVRTPSGINPATNCFDHFVVSIQFKSSPPSKSVYVCNFVYEL